MARPNQAVLDFMSKYGVDSDEIWEVHGSTWVVKHKALERIAVEQKIVLQKPELKLCDLANGFVVVLVEGSKEGRSIFSFGEASPKNCKNSYPVAMAEKRAIDRVVLKLLNAHATLYSEAEADEFSEQRPEKRGELPKKDARGVYQKLQYEIRAATSRDHLRSWAEGNKDRIAVLPSDWQDILRLQYEEMLADLRQQEAA